MSETGDVRVFIEIPGGSRNKYELDKDTNQIVLDRMLFTSMRYPADYGFIDNTLAGDGDPLDALVLVGEPTFPGCNVDARVVGVFHMTDEKGPDEKLICVSKNDPTFLHVHNLDDLRPSLLDEISHFFQVYKDLEAGKTEVNGFGDVEQALAALKDSRERYAAEGK